MSKHDNYPDNIRSFDHVPGSPFFQDPDEGLEDEAAEIRLDLDRILDKRHHESIGKIYDIEPVDVLLQIS